MSHLGFTTFACFVCVCATVSGRPLALAAVPVNALTPSPLHVPFHVPSESPREALDGELAPGPGPAELEGSGAPSQVHAPLTASASDADWLRAETYILAVSQADTSCPNERSCPGFEALTELCNKPFSNFRCDTAWSTGMAGLYAPGVQQGDSAIQAALFETAEITCQSCASTLKVLTIRDSPLGVSFGL